METLEKWKDIVDATNAAEQLSYYKEKLEQAENLRHGLIELHARNWQRFERMRRSALRYRSALAAKKIIPSAQDLHAEVMRRARKKYGKYIEDEPLGHFYWEVAQEMNLKEEPPYFKTGKVGGE